MTFTSDNGFEIITPNKYDFELGKLWKNNIKKSDIKLEKQFDRYAFITLSALE